MHDDDVMMYYDVHVQCTMYCSAVQHDVVSTYTRMYINLHINDDHQPSIIVAEVQKGELAPDCTSSRQKQSEVPLSKYPPRGNTAHSSRNKRLSRVALRVLFSTQKAKALLDLPTEMLCSTPTNHSAWFMAENEGSS